MSCAAGLSQSKWCFQRQDKGNSATTLNTTVLVICTLNDSTNVRALYYYEVYCYTPQHVYLTRKIPMTMLYRRQTLAAPHVAAKNRRREQKAPPPSPLYSTRRTSRILPGTPPPSLPSPLPSAQLSLCSAFLAEFLCGTHASYVLFYS